MSMAGGNAWSSSSLQLSALVAALLIAVLWWRLAWQPRAIARSFARQGIRGPPYALLTGSLLEMKRLAAAGRVGAPPLDAGSHEIMPVVLLALHRWTVDYGRTFLFWFGPTPVISSTDLQLIKQVLTERTGLFQKDYMLPHVKSIIGTGLVSINGEDWKRHRRVVRPAFNHESLKSMAAVTAEVTEEMLKLWREQILQCGDKQAAEIDMSDAMCEVTTKIIGRVAFGTRHWEADEVIFLLREMQKHAAAGLLDAPILWYLPTRRNRKMRRMDELLRAKIMAMMQARIAAKDEKSGYGDDLLGLMLEAWSPERRGRSSETLSTEEVIGECKTFFAAGQETSSTLLVWTMFLLSTHPQWQDRVREEVLSGFGGEVPINADDLSKLKLLNMVLLEASRLYPPVVYIHRTAAADVTLGGIEVPKGTVIGIPIGMLHRDKDVWGSDADEFNPMRFENGGSKAAKDPNALLSFSLGPRACIGQSFSIMETQIIMAMILRKFIFSLSPTYVHKPKYLFTLAPKSGMPLIFRNILEVEEKVT